MAKVARRIVAGAEYEKARRSIQKIAEMYPVESMLVVGIAAAEHLGHPRKGAMQTVMRALATAYAEMLDGDEKTKAEVLSRIVEATNVLSTERSRYLRVEEVCERYLSGGASDPTFPAGDNPTWSHPLARALEFVATLEQIDPAFRSLALNPGRGADVVLAEIEKQSKASGEGKREPARDFAVRITVAADAIEPRYKDDAGRLIESPEKHAERIRGAFSDHHYKKNKKTVERAQKRAAKEALRRTRRASD